METYYVLKSESNLELSANLAKLKIIILSVINSVRSISIFKTETPPPRTGTPSREEIEENSDDTEAA